MVSIFHVQERVYQRRRNELLLYMAVLRYSLWYTGMFVWLVPHGYDLGGTLGIVALNFVLGGIIGGVILIWRLVCAAWYIPLTMYRLLTVGKGSTVEINFKE